MEVLQLLVVIVILGVVVAIWRHRVNLGRRRRREDQLHRLELGFAQLRAGLESVTAQVAVMHRQMLESNLVAAGATTGPATRAAPEPAAIAAAVSQPALAEEAQEVEEPIPPLETLPASRLPQFEPPPASATPAAWPGPMAALEAAEPEIPGPPRKPGLIRSALAATGEGVGRLLGLKPGEQVNWEALVGGRWLNLLGMLVLVVGIALLSQQALLYLGREGKIAFGAGLALAMLSGGVLLERSQAYRWIGRTLIGGGWSLAYFVAYAAYNVEQTRIIESPGLALVVLIAVAAGVIGHSLRYRSQVVTGLAFGLAFLAIVLTPVTIASLVAAAVLAAALVAVVRTLSWHHLAVAGVLGTYANHWVWLQKVIAQPPANAAATGAGWLDATLPAEAVFWLSCGLLAFYWMLFSLVSLRRRVEDRRSDELLYLIVSVANTVGVVALLYNQVSYAFGQDHLWAVTAPVALACAGLALLDWRLGLRLLFVANAALALAAFSATLPLAITQYGWQWGWLGPYLAAGGFATLLVGRRTDALLLRLLSYLACLAAFANVVGVRLWEADATSINVLWLATLATVAAFQAAAELLRGDTVDQGFPPPLLGLAASFMLAGLIWIHLPHDLVAPVWMMLGLALFEFGLRRRGYELQGYALMVLATFAAVAVNIYGYGLEDAVLVTWLPGWLAPLVVAVGLYYYFIRNRSEAVRPGLLPMAGDIASAVASLLVALAAWMHLPSLGVAPAWAVLGLVLFEAATRLEAPLLRLQAHIAMAAVFVRLFMANLVVDGDLGGISFRLLTVVPVVLIALYLRYQVPGVTPVQQQKGPVAFLLSREAGLAAGLYSWASAILVVMLFRFEFGRAHTVAAWAPLLLAMLWFGRRFNDRNLRFQSYVLGAYAFFRGWSTNIYLTGQWLGFDERLTTTVPMIAALFAASLLCRGGAVEAAAPASKRRVVSLLTLAERHAVAWFAALGAAFLAVLLYYELPANYGSIALALEGLLLLIGGFLLRERSYRLLGLTVLFGTLVKAVFIDLADVQEIYRIMSFIVLGLILLLASVGYTRYRGLIEKYL